MSHPTREAEVAALRDQLMRANRAYYERDTPEISDAEYDHLFRQLQSLEAAHPELVTPDSPTQRVGGAPAAFLPKHTHLRSMLSLPNAFSSEELMAWEERAARVVPTIRSAGYAVELKIDGAAISLTYTGGELTRGATRGNGSVGEDVTPNIRTIDDIPLRLRGSNWPALMEVRGEVYFDKEAFRKLNARREREGEAPFANPRNSAAGSLRQLDPTITRSRRLRCFVFQVEVIEGNWPVHSHHEMLHHLAKWGFPVEPHHRLCHDLPEVMRHIAGLETLIPSLPFEADGVVVKVDNRAMQTELGVIGQREPRWAIARKFAPEVATTRLREIRVNVGRTGALVPWAVLEPVELGGVTISSATLHNEDLIAVKDIRVGDLVEIIRAGEVIPQIVAAKPEARDGSQKPFHFPTACPVCGTPTVREEAEAMRYCPNPACPGKQVEGIIHFAARETMDIRGLGEERVRQLVEAGLVHDVGDLYTLTSEKLVQLDRFAEQSASQLVSAIDASRIKPLSALLFGLGIRHVGKSAAQALARHFSTLPALMDASPEAIAEVDGIGPVIAEAVHEWSKNPGSRRLVAKLAAQGLNLAEPKTAATGSALAGLTVVLTGTLPTLSRSEAGKRIELQGGKLSESVSKKTSLLVAGDAAGSKLEKARKLGVAVIDEAELLRRLGESV